MNSNLAFRQKGQSLCHHFLKLFIINLLMKLLNFSGKNYNINRMIPSELFKDNTVIPQRKYLYDAYFG